MKFDIIYLKREGYMSVQFPKSVQVALADYVPAETALLLTEGVTTLTVEGTADSVHLLAFLKIFNKQSYLLFFSEKMLGSPGNKVEASKEVELVNKAKRYDSRFYSHETEAADNTVPRLLEGYSLIKEAVAILGASNIQQCFNAEKFNHELFGFGYFRPRVRMLPPYETEWTGLGPYTPADRRNGINVGETRAVVYQRRFYNPWGEVNVPPRKWIGQEEGQTETDFHNRIFGMLFGGTPTIGKDSHGAYDSRLLPYRVEDNTAVAPAFAQIFLEAGVKVPRAMWENAKADKQSAVVELIEEYQPEAREGAAIAGAELLKEHLPWIEAWTVVELIKDYIYPK